MVHKNHHKNQILVRGYDRLFGGIGIKNKAKRRKLYKMEIRNREERGRERKGSEPNIKYTCPPILATLLVLPSFSENLEKKKERERKKGERHGDRRGKEKEEKPNESNSDCLNKDTKIGPMNKCTFVGKICLWFNSSGFIKVYVEKKG